MDYVKALIVGFMASFMMFVVLAPMIMFDSAPFNLPPPAAFLAALGLPTERLPWIMHFLYGMLWSVVFVCLFGRNGNVIRGVYLSLGLWFLLMIVYSPLIGWGFFGVGEAHLLRPDDPLYLRDSGSYVAITLGVHFLYGIIIGWLNPLWEQVDTL